MKKFAKPIIIAVVFIAVIAVAAFAYSKLSDKVQPETTVAQSETESTETPYFSVLDADGKSVELSDMKGKKTVINFWATWCGYCVKEMPHFQTLFDEMGDKVNFMMIDLTDGRQETREMADAFIAEKGFTFPVYYDSDLNSAAAAFGLISVPLTVLIDENGNQLDYHLGAMDEATLREFIESAE